jgi:hypothetical protein
MRLVWVIAFTLLTGWTVTPTAATSDFSNNPITRLFSRTDQPLREYRAFRRMHASSEKSAKYEAWLDAWTELKDGRFTYQIVSESGSDTVRSKVLHAVLAREQELINSGDSDKGDLTSANYEFAEAGRDADGAQVVQMKPRRSDVLLVDGRAVLNDRGELVRVEGKLAKNPSFWTSLVNIVRRYARIGGVRVPVATETTAKVKFVGTAQMDVVYDYHSINGRQVAVVSERDSSVPARIAGQSDSSAGEK